MLIGRHSWRIRKRVLRDSYYSLKDMLIDGVWDGTNDDQAKHIKSTEEYIENVE